MRHILQICLLALLGAQTVSSMAAESGEELYDHAIDPNEWRNLASKPKFKTAKADLAKSLSPRPTPPHWDPRRSERRNNSNENALKLRWQKA